MRSLITVGLLLSFCCLSPLLCVPALCSSPFMIAAGQSRIESNSATISSLEQPGTRKTISAGEQITLHSKILNEDRNIFVALPASYAGSTQKYPVLYLTDAQFYFDQTRSTATGDGKKKVSRTIGAKRKKLAGNHRRET